MICYNVTLTTSIFSTCSAIQQMSSLLSTKYFRIRTGSDIFAQLDNTSLGYFRIHKYPFHSMKNPSRRLRAKAKERASKEGEKEVISKRSSLTRRSKDQKDIWSSSGEELVIEKALVPAPLYQGEQSDIGVKCCHLQSKASVLGPLPELQHM